MRAQSGAADHRSGDTLPTQGRQHLPAYSTLRGAATRSERISNYVDRHSWIPRYVA